MTDFFKIPKDILFIITESDMRNSPEINIAIRFFIKKLRKEDEFKKFKENIKKIKKESDKENEEKKFLEYLYKEFIKQQKEYEERKKINDERRKIEQEEKMKSEAVFQEKMRLHELNEKLKSLNWDDINDELNNILSNLRNLFNENNNNNSKTYSFYKELYDNIYKQFTKLYKLGISYFFKQDYSFKAGSNYFKLDELKNIISEFEELVSSNFEISIDIAEKFLETRNNDDEIIEGNIILAIKIAHTIFMNYITELEENFKELRKEFDSSVSDELIYVALFVNNNYIDDARAFIYQKKNSGEEQDEENWETFEEGVMPNTPPSNSGPKFSTEIHNIRTSRRRTEAEIIQEYDDEQNKLHETQRNIIIFDGETYYITDFIRMYLDDETVYNSIDFSDIEFYLEIKELNLLSKYLELLNCDLSTFIKKYITYKILQHFYEKQNNILSDDVQGGIEQLYNSNNELHDMFIRLILYYKTNKHVIFNAHGINLYNYLKLIACVIVFYYKKLRNKSLKLSSIIEIYITDTQQKIKALSYISYLEEAIRTRASLTDEEYFKPHGKLRRKKRMYKNKSKKKNSSTESSSRNMVANIENRLASRLHRTRPKLKLPQQIKQIVKPSPSSQTNNSSPSTKKKVKATDEDKIRIINETFKNMVDIDLSNKITEPDNFILGCNQTSFTTLQTIYQKNNHILNQLITLLVSLKSRISIDNKKKADNCNIYDNLKSFIRLLYTISEILHLSVSKEKQSIIRLLFEKIIENINKYIKIYNNLCSKNNEEFLQVNNSNVSKFLDILGINIQDFHELNQQDKVEEIKKSYKKLALEKHPNKQQQNRPNMSENEIKEAKAEFQILLKAYQKLLEIYSNGTLNNRNNMKFKLNMGLRETAKTSTGIILSNKSLHLKTMSLLDIIIENLNPLLKGYSTRHDSAELNNFLNEKITDLNDCYLLFTPFNTLFDDMFEQRRNHTHKFILLLDNDKVKLFFSSLTNAPAINKKDIDRYKQLCYNIQLFIRYINYGIEFISSNNINKEKLNELVYYNFFHNLNDIIQIILKSLNQDNPNYHLLKIVQKALGIIVKLMKKKNKDLYELSIEKNNTETEIFSPNRLNTKKLGKEQIQEFKRKIKEEISEFIKKNNNSLNDLTEDLLKELINKMNTKYEIKKIKISRDFLQKLKTTFRLEFSGNIDSISIEEIIKKIVNNIKEQKAHIKENILEFLYIYVISFSKQEKFKIFNNIKEQIAQIKASNATARNVLSNIAKEKGTQQELITKISLLKQFETGLKVTAASNEQKLIEYEKKLIQLLGKNPTNSQKIELLEYSNSKLAKQIKNKYAKQARLLLKSDESNINKKFDTFKNNLLKNGIDIEFGKTNAENQSSSFNFSNKTKQGKINELFNRLFKILIKKYNISFIELVKSQNLDDMIRSFFDKINKVFDVENIYKNEYEIADFKLKEHVDIVIDGLKKSKKKPKYLVEFIIIDAIRTVITRKLKDLKNYEEIKNKLLMLLFIFVDSFSYPKNKGNKNETANTASKLLKRNNKLNAAAVQAPSAFNIRSFDARKLVANELLKDKSKKEKDKISPRIKQIIDDIGKETRNKLLNIKSLNEFRNEVKKRLNILSKK